MRKKTRREHETHDIHIANMDGLRDNCTKIIYPTRFAGNIERALNARSK